MAENNQGTAMQPYGDKGEIRDLANRVLAMLPGGTDLTKNEAMALAQLAVAYGLNPFHGEVWYIKGKGAMVGIKGLRKAARKQAFFQTVPRNMTMAEREERLLKDADIGRVCELYRWGNGIPPAQNLPFFGEGIAYAKETPPHTKSRVWLAEKRAEADALKKAYDLPFGYTEQLNGPGPTVEIVADEAEQIGAMVVAAEGRAAPREPEHTAKEAADLLYGDWDGEPTATPAVTWGKPAAQVKTDRWEEAVGWLLERTGFYLDPNDDAATEAAILETALGLGFPLITDDNLKACLGALLEYAKEELAQEGAE